MEGHLGETITLHGASYVGDSVYLFLTGPGLPENGVTLTNANLRADQGHFTVVDLDENQEWTYVWKTSRIRNEIDRGTYLVYVTNQPVDLSRIETSRYKTYKIFLRESGESKISINTGQSYTLKPEERVSNPPTIIPVNITSPATVTTSPPPLTTIPPVTRAANGSSGAITAIICCVYCILLTRARQ